MSEDILEFQFPRKTPTIIKVVGVGGGGGNAVNHMYEQGIQDVSFALCNTDNQALANSPVKTKLQLGPQTTGGLGAGNKPEVAKAAAEESAEDIKELFNDGTKMAFITAGMGGGTGTGSAPVVAGIAKNMGILTVGIVTIPFMFEGKKKIIQALKGVEEISKNVDALLVINNERLIDIYADLTIPNAFAKADDTLTVAAKGIAEIITVHGHINLDFADVNTILQDGGVAIMSSGFGEGEYRVEDAFRNALHSPLLNNNDVFAAKKVLFNIYSGDTPLIVEEMGAVSDFMKRFGPEVEVIWGTATENGLTGDKVKVTLLATGFDMSNIGIEIDPDDLTDDERWEIEERKRKEEEEKRRIADMMEKHYGKENMQTMGINPFFTPKPIILSAEDLDDDRIIEALENTPVFKRGENFDPKNYKPEVNTASTSLFN
ncbi:cell division protein FtsZ [Viscerimonas tarda]